MSLSTNPLRIPISEMGVTPAHFLHPTAAHGPGHVNRVIYLSLAICKMMGWPELMPSAWAAAFLHDLARIGDGVDADHGYHAVATHSAQHMALFRRGGMRREDYFAAMEAVAIHSLPVENHENRLCDVLKDADALDRVMFGDLQVNRLRLEFSPYLVGKARQLFLETHVDGMETLPVVWEKAVKIFNPHIGLADKVPLDFTQVGKPHTRAFRRAMKGEIGSTVLPRLLGTSTRKLAEEWVDAVPGLRENMDGLDVFLDVVPRPPVGDVVTFMRPESYHDFCIEGRYRSIWELDKLTWHTRYNDNPRDGRALTEKRLFGERCAHLVHAVLFNGKEKEPVERLSEMYGSCPVHWKPSVLDGATFTFGDSQCAPYAVPYSPRNLRKMLILTLLARKAASLGLDDRGLREWFPNYGRIHFVELQIHQQLTPDDMLNTTPAEG